jgi:hypothetical protein
MMSRDGTLLLLFLAQILAPFMLALMFGYGRRRPPAGQGARGVAETPASTTPPPGQWPVIAEFARRRDRFKRWLLGTLFASLALVLVGLPLTAGGVLLLLPLYGALLHLRCPVCDTSTTLKGVSDGRHCHRCHQRLRY